MSLKDIRIPTLLIDERVCRRNIARMRSRADVHALRFRPHFKTHQSRRIGSWFRDEAVSAITVSSVGMARYFADDGWTDITIAFPVNLRETSDIDALAARVSLGIVLESADTARILGSALHQPVDVWLKVDTGYGRTGILHSDHTRLLAVADAVGSVRNFRLRGLLTHGGDTYDAAAPEEIRRRFALSRIHMLEAATVLRGNHPQLEISVGDTPGCTLAEAFAGIDEIRPGNFVFHDLMQLQLGVCTVQDISVALACPVVAIHEEREEVVLYGGAVHLSREYATDAAGRRMFGLVAPFEDDRWGQPVPGAFVARLSQEHGIVHVPAEQCRCLRAGDLLAVLPVHSCLTSDCMRRYRCLDGTFADHLGGVTAAGGELHLLIRTEDHTS